MDRKERFIDAVKFGLNIHYTTQAMEAGSARGAVPSYWAVNHLGLAYHDVDNMPKSLHPEEAACMFLTFHLNRQGGKDEFGPEYSWLYAPDETGEDEIPKSGD